MLICERITEMKRNLSPIRDIRDIGKIYEWVNDLLQEAHSKAEGEFAGYTYNGVELTELHFFYYYQLSFIYIIENNFNHLKEYLPDCYHLPYKFWSLVNGRPYSAIPN